MMIHSWEHSWHVCLQQVRSVCQQCCDLRPPYEPFRRIIYHSEAVWENDRIGRQTMVCVSCLANTLMRSRSVRGSLEMRLAACVCCQGDECWWTNTQGQGVF